MSPERQVRRARNPVQNFGSSQVAWIAEFLSLRTRAEDHLHPIVRGILGIIWEYACSAICKEPVRATAAIRWSVQRCIVHSGARKIAIGAGLQTPRWPGRAARRHK